MTKSSWAFRNTMRPIGIAHHLELFSIANEFIHQHFHIGIMHLPGAEILLAVAFVLLVLFIVTGFKEVWYSKNIPESEKTMWLVGFFFMSWITGLIYFWLGRKRVIG